MKKLLLLLIGIIACISLFAQVPNAFKYQAVARDASGELIVNQSVGLQISLLQGSSTGPAIYTETHVDTSNNYGLINLEIGNGTSTDDFSAIDWSNGPYFLQIEIDLSGGIDYQLIGTSQLLSMPYALHAKAASQLEGTITESQITDLNHFTNDDEIDPVFDTSLASRITSADTTFWNEKSEFDGNYSSLTNAPDIANTTNEKTIQLNADNSTSHIEITNSSGSSVFKVDGSGKMTGDGSGLSNVKPLAAYGNKHNHQILSNSWDWDNVKEVTLTVPSSGIAIILVTGTVDWESTGWDLALVGILMDKNPNTSSAAEDEWWDYSTWITDYNLADSSDQYTSFVTSRGINVTAGTHTFYLWASKYSEDAKVELRNVNMSVMYFPTGGTGKSSDAIMLKEEEPDKVTKRIPRTLSGYE